MCPANDGDVCNACWRQDRLLYQLPVKDTGRHAGPQAKFLPRSTEASEQDLPSYRC